MGIRRSEGKSVPEVTESVLMAIEMAMELQKSMNGTVPANNSGSPELDSSAMPPPPNPAAVQESGVTDVPPMPEPEPEPEPIVVKTVQVPRTPPPPPSDNLVVLASSDSDIDRAVSETRKPRVRSVFMRGGSTKVKIEDVMGWIVNSFPLQLKVHPKGIDQEIILDRKVYAIPCQGEGRKNEKESVAKICYKHPKMDSTMEVGVGIRVGDVEEGYPIVGDVLLQIQAQAAEMYKARPATIEGKAPSGPDLYGAHRAMSSAINDPRRRAEAPPMKFKDADEPLQYPELDATATK
jgi:hypothetical protein